MRTTDYSFVITIWLRSFHFERVTPIVWQCVGAFLISRLQKDRRFEKNLSIHILSGHTPDAIVAVECVIVWNSICL